MSQLAATDCHQAGSPSLDSEKCYGSRSVPEEDIKEKFEFAYLQTRRREALNEILRNVVAEHAFAISSGKGDDFRIGMRPVTGEVPIVCNPVFSFITDDRSVGFLNLQQREAKSHLSDLAEQQVAEVLHACRSFHDFEPKCFTSSCHVLLQGFIKRIVNVDQHAMIVILLEPWLNLRVKVSKERADIAVTFHLEVAPQSVAMTMKIPAFIQQCLISVRGVKLVLLLDDHADLTS